MVINMKLISCADMQREEKEATGLFGIPSALLMENAAVSVIREAEAFFDIKDKKIVVVCGGGNNGGDGFAIARHLFLKNVDVTVFGLFNSDKLTENAKMNLDIIKKLGVKFTGNTDFSDFDLIFDCLLGIGIKGNVRENVSDVIDCINESGKPVISVGVPSGIDADSGKVLGNAVKADLTVSMGYGKIGLYTGSGYEYAGKVVIGDIALPKNECAAVQLTDEALMKKWKPAGSVLSNKGDNGKVLIAAGSVGYTGAAALCASGALRGGAGLVSLAVPKNLNAIMEIKLTEAMTFPLPCEDFFNEKAADDFLKKAEEYDAAAIGPGLVRNEQTVAFVHKIIRGLNKPLVIDADGIYAVFMNINVLKEAKGALILTPHPGEFARLIGRTAEEINDDRTALAREFAERFGVTLLLKGAGTVIAMPDGEVYINPTGNSGMAKGGSGDILTGITAAYLAKGYENPAAAAAYNHGKAGDRAAEVLGKDNMHPSDILKYI